MAGDAGEPPEAAADDADLGGKRASFDGRQAHLEVGLEQVGGIGLGSTEYCYKNLIDISENLSFEM